MFEFTGWYANKRISKCTYCILEDFFNKVCHFELIETFEKITCISG